MAEAVILERTAVVRRGRRLEYFTIAWNSLEGIVAVVAGILAGSISLVGFGVDSFIEVTSGAALLLCHSPLSRKTWRGSTPKKRGDERGRKADRVLHLSIGYSARWFTFGVVSDLWWADPVPALTMVPIIANEGIEGLKGRGCDDCCAGDRKA